MNKDKINISKIETFLNGIIDNVVSQNTFYGYMPNTSVVQSSGWTDMCLIEIPNGIRDMEAYGEGTVLIWLYARPLESGRKNVAKMSELEAKLNEVIKHSNSKDYQIARRLTYTDYDTDIKWHCNVVELILKVF